MRSTNVLEAPQISTHGADPDRYAGYMTSARLHIKHPWSQHPHSHVDELLDLAFSCVSAGHPLEDWGETRVIASRGNPDAILLEDMEASEPSEFVLLVFKKRHHISGWHHPRVRRLTLQAAQSIIDEDARKLDQ